MALAETRRGPVYARTPRGARLGLGIVMALAAAFIIGLILWTIFAPDEAEIPVVGARDLGAIVGGEAGELAEDNLVQVRGIVRIFRLADIEREIGADLDDAAWREWEGQPVVVATEVDRTVVRPFGEEFVDARLATIERLEDEPNLFVGQRVVLTGEIDERLGVRGFVLEED